MLTLVSAWSCDMQNPRPCARGFLHVCSNQLCNGAMWWVLSMVLIACFIASRRSGQAVNHLSPLAWSNPAHRHACLQPMPTGSLLGLSNLLLLWSLATRRFLLP